MAKRDFYEILGVPKNASDEDIKESYLTHAIACHFECHQHAGYKVHALKKG